MTQRDQTALTGPAPVFPDEFPRFGLGCASLGNIFAQVPEAEANATLRAAWDDGVRLFDTAPWYGHGLSEARLGWLLRQVPRGQAVVTTKVGRVYRPAARGQDARVQWQGGLNFGLTFDYSAAGVEQALEQSLLRLGTPVVEALIIHDLDRPYHGPAYDGHMTALTGSGLAALHRMKADGRIAAIGMGINTTADFAAVADWIEVDFFLVAMPYTLLEQPALAGPMAACLRRGIKVVIGAPFASGLLTDPSRPGLMYNYGPVPDAMRDKALAIAAVCARHGVPLMAAALQFPLAHPAVTAVIPGAVTPDQVRSNHANVRAPIPFALWHELRDLGLIDPASPLPR
jgi:D-threo-aldose 1-dehydrogenase